jgi:hypothetical protein
MNETTLPATTQGTPEKREIALLKAIGLDRVAPEQRELALAIADRYELDLMLKHLVLIDGKPFITRDGLLYIAHRSGHFDGIEVTAPVKDDKYWRATCTVWRDDKSRPFVYPGRFPVGAKNDEEMAIKVAESMSLRRAFNVSAPTVDERWASDDAEVPEHEAPKASTLSELARARAAAVQAPPAVDAPTAEEATFRDADATPEAPSAPGPVAAVVACGEVAQDGLMTGAVCILKPDHTGAHKSADGSWPQ